MGPGGRWQRQQGGRFEARRQGEGDGMGELGG